MPKYYAVFNEIVTYMVKIEAADEEEIYKKYFDGEIEYTEKDICEVTCEDIVDIVRVED